MDDFRDTYRHKGLRRQLLVALQERGILDERILEAMDAVPRHFFLDRAFAEWAYQDKAFSIGHSQTISQPYTVAFQTQLLELQVRDKVLEIGTGSGYQAAILAKMGAKVYTVERQEGLYIQAKALLEVLKPGHILFYLRDGMTGLPARAPFDKILVTAGALEVPDALLTQLKVGGMLVIPVGDEHIQRMRRIRRVSESEFVEEIHGDFRFVPLLSGLERNP